MDNSVPLESLVGFSCELEPEIFILQAFTLNRTSCTQGMAFANWTKVVVSLNAAS